MSQRCNETLTIASVIGREFEPRQVAPLVEDMSEDRLLEVLEEALSARVIEEMPQAVGRYQFTHALIQETLTEELTLTRRVRLHARIAETLEKLFGETAEAHAAEPAHYFAEAEAVLGTEKLVRYSLLAGERALGNFAYEGALLHFHRGLTAKGGWPPILDNETAELLFGLGRALASTSQPHQMQGAVDSIRHAFEYYVQIGAVARAVAVAEFPLPATAVRLPGVIELIGLALSLVPPDSRTAGLLQATYGAALFVGRGDLDSALGAFAKALAIAERDEDRPLRMKALIGALRVSRYNPSRHQEGIEHGLQAIELAHLLDEPLWELMAHYYTGHIFIFIGDSEAGRNHMASALNLAEELRDRYWLASALRGNGDAAQAAGDWQTAREFSERCLSVAPMDPRILDNRAL